MPSHTRTLSSSLSAFAIGLTLLAACADQPTAVDHPAAPTPGPSFAVGTDPATGASIITDKDDYVPGDTVRITGTNWTATEAVHIVLTEDPQTHDPVAWDVVADNTGAFTDVTYLVEDHDLGVTFTLTATGATSGSSATAVFTDGTTSVSSATLTPSGPSPSQAFDVAVTVTITSPGGVKPWKATQWRIDGGAASCVNTPDHITAGSGITETLVGLVAPSVSGPHTLTLRLFQDDLCSATQSASGNTDFAFNVSSTNTAPAVSAGSDATIDEGGTFSQSGSFTDPDADSWTATVDYGDGSGVQPLVLVGKTFSLSHIYADNGTYTVTVSVGDGTGSGTDDVKVTVNNVAPVVSPGSATATLDEGDTFTRAGSFTDPGSDSWTATVDYGDGSGVQALALSGKTFGLSHVYADNGVYTVTVSVSDDDTGSGSGQVTVTVNNVAPTVNAGVATATLDEGDTFTRAGSFTDPGADTWNATVDYGDGSGVQALALSGKTFGLSHVYADNGVYTVTVTVTDDDSGADSGQIVITVNNVAPHITTISIPVAPIAVGNPVTVGWNFTDPGADTWTGQISWDVGLPFGAGFPCLVTRSCSATNSLSSGVYTVSVKVTDDDAGTDDSTMTTYIVVYDPNGSFVTGGGWINSPAGAYAADLSLTGRATFGFVSKYLKGAQTPSGNTEFQFHEGGLNFKSTSYQWLVVSGARAQYKGVGQINGAGNYGFLLTAIDGQVTGGGGADRFRIKIWDLDNGGAIIYDNGLGAAEDSDTSTPLAGGSIVIHK